MEFGIRPEGVSFNPLPQKVPMRYSFSLDQKRVLMKHYENGMHGQSLAYQDKIVTCAQEAGVDFDIVRNWIGNMRRKRRMESAQKSPMPGLMLQLDQSAENKRRYFSHSGAFDGPQFLIRHPSNGGQQPNQTEAGPPPRVGGPGLNITLPLRNTPLAPRDQNISQSSCLGQQSVSIGQPGSGTQVTLLPTPAKREADGDKNSCLVAGPTPHQSVSQPQPQPQPQQQGGLNALGADQFPDETIPVIMRSRGMAPSQEIDDGEWRQQQIQRIMQQVQQSVHQLESLGCECVVASVVPSDGGTYITGTPVAVQYFSEIQKIQAMADYVHPAGPPSAYSSDSEPNDATEEVTEGVNSLERKQPGQGSGTPKEELEGGECLDQTGGDRSQKGDEEKVDLDRRDGEVIRAGEEIYIVNKEHYIIGTGTLLPAPHRHIELKNAPLC